MRIGARWPPEPLPAADTGSAVQSSRSLAWTPRLRVAPDVPDGLFVRHPVTGHATGRAQRDAALPETAGMAASLTQRRQNRW